MMDLIKYGVANAVLVIRANRISRNSMDAGYVISLMDEKKLLYIRTPNSTCYTSSSTDKMMIALELIFSKKDSDDKGDMVKEGQKTKAIKGYPHGVAAIGFLNDKTEEKGNRKWMVDPVNLPLIKQLLDMYLTGLWSVNKLAKYARKEMQVRTTKHKRTGGKLLTPSRVHTILRDSIYAGFFNYGGVRYELNKSLPRLITEHQHNKILMMLSSRGVAKIQSHKTTYSGFIKAPDNAFVGQDIKLQLICDCKHKFSCMSKTACTKCGKEIDKMEDSKHLLYTYYYNVPRRKEKLGAKAIEENKVTSYLLKYFDENLQMSPALAQWSLKYLGELRDKELDETRAIENNHKVYKNDSEKKKKRMRELLADGVISTAEYQQDIRDLEKEVSANASSKVKVDWYTEAVKIFDLNKAFAEVMQSDNVDAKREVLSKLSSNLIWNEENLSIINTKPIQALIDGLKLARQQKPPFEPKNIIDTSGSNEVFATVYPIVLQKLDRFNNLNWADIELQLELYLNR